MRTETRKRWFNYGILAMVTVIMAFIVARGYAANERIDSEAVAEQTRQPG